MRLSQAKQRLIMFRHRCPCLSDEQARVVQSILRHAQPDGQTSAFGAEGALSLADLQTVMELDKWKDNQAYGNIWVSLWLHWQPPLSTPGLKFSDFSEGRTEKKREANFKWYFGCTSRAPSKLDEVSICKDVPAELESLSAVDSDDPAMVNSSGESDEDVCFCRGLPVLVESKDRNEDYELQRLRWHLQHNMDPVEQLTVGTLNSIDDIPLGTDLDPMNDYRNNWAANKIGDENDLRRVLLEFNLGCRVIDAENVGKRYAEEVSKMTCWDIKGVRKALHFFTSRGIRVVAVSRRRELKSLESDDVGVVIADSTDDVIILKQAQLLNCPVVSRDGFKDWISDPRINNDLRQWLRTASLLQVRFFWSVNGDFQPDYDLPTPVLTPSAQALKESANDQRGWPCLWCGRCVCGESGQWTANSWGGWDWLCQDCRSAHASFWQ